MLQYLSPDSCSCTMCPHRSGIFYYLTTHSLLWISHPSDLHSDFSVNLFFYLASGGSCPSKEFQASLYASPYREEFHSTRHHRSASMNESESIYRKWLIWALFSVAEFRYIF